jgi:hypothetical protein
VWGETAQTLRRLVALVRYLPGDGALWHETHDEQGRPTFSDPADVTVITSLRGVDLGKVFAG